MTWHIITSEYPPDIGGVSNYTCQVAEALALDGHDVHVWCPPASRLGSAPGVHLHTDVGRFRPSDLARTNEALDAYAAPRCLLVQWVPHGYGYRSMNLWFCLWLAGRAAKGDVLELMVHEPFLELKRGPLHHLAIALVHRLMTMVLMRAASRVWVSIPAWVSRLRPYACGRDVRIDWLPIPSSVPSAVESRDEIRGRYVSGGQALVGHFGSYGPDAAPLLEERLPAIMGSHGRPSLLLIGARSAPFRDALLAQHPDWRGRVHATGILQPAALAGQLRACDLLVQPYPDGITSRRTSAMACLALGLPVVTTSGHLTEPLWAESGAVALADVADVQAFVAAAVHLLATPEDRRRLAEQGRRVYRDRFDITHVIAALTAESRTDVGLRSCA